MIQPKPTGPEIRNSKREIRTDARVEKGCASRAGGLEKTCVPYVYFYACSAADSRVQSSGKKEEK